MKKILICVFCIVTSVFLTACSMDNTPTKRVENFLDSYTRSDDTVLKQLKDMVDSDSLMNDDQRTRYSDIMKRQYKDMTYEIKNEVIDGDNATVTAEIEVYDYYTVNRNSQDYYNNNPNEFAINNNDDTGAMAADEDGSALVDAEVKDSNRAATDMDSSKFVDYRLENLKNAKDRIKYTIDFTLKKVNNEWKLNEIDDATRQKIHGLFEH